MFENFKAYDDDYRLTDDSGSAMYLVIFNEKGYDDAIEWIAEECMEQEAQLLKNRESYCYEFDSDDGMYKPLEKDYIPTELIPNEPYFYRLKEKENANNISQKFKIKIQLVNGTTIEPNLYSNDFHEIADVIQELSCEKLFAGQIKNIKIE
jgi:hypothetical protein